jgi:hypothetical protein
LGVQANAVPPEEEDSMPKENPESLKHFRNFHNDVQKDLQRRIKNHRIRIAQQAMLAPSQRALNLLADGDSWFDNPLSGDLPLPSDITVQLKKLIVPDPAILPLAHWGLATTQLMGVSKRNQLVSQLSNPQNGRFDAILFSGGGNDLIGDQFRLWLEEATAVSGDPAKALDVRALGDIVDVVITAYRDLIVARNSVDPNIPIFVHAYDFARPTGISVCGGVVGPWLFPSLLSRGWMKTTKSKDVRRGAVIVKAILTEFKKQMVGLSSDTKNNVIFVGTQGTLRSANDWANELHPTPDGFRRIAQKFAKALTRLNSNEGPKARLLRPSEGKSK